MYTNRNFVNVIASGALRSLTVIAVVAASSFIGCSWPASLSDQNTASNSTPENASTADSNDSSAADLSSNSLCRNDYYPISEEIREYKIGGDGPGTYKLSQRTAGEEGFLETRVFAQGLTVENNWVCTPEGLRNAEYKNTITMNRGNFEMDTVRSTGITLPKVWETGKVWTTNYDVKVNVAAGPIKTAADGNVTVVNTIGPLSEKVTANGKEYEAARVDSTLEIKITMKGVSPPPTKFTSTNWFAKGVGLVRQETSGAFGKQTVEITSAQ